MSTDTTSSIPGMSLQMADHVDPRYIQVPPVPLAFQISQAPGQHPSALPHILNDDTSQLPSEFKLHKLCHLFYWQSPYFLSPTHCICLSSNKHYLYVERIPTKAKKTKSAEFEKFHTWFLVNIILLLKWHHLSPTIIPHVVLLNSSVRHVLKVTKSINHGWASEIPEIISDSHVIYWTALHQLKNYLAKGQKLTQKQLVWHMLS